MTRATEAQTHTLAALRERKLPCTFIAASLAAPEVSAARISHALTALVKRRVILAVSNRTREVTRWTVVCINPETQWKTR